MAVHDKCGFPVIENADGKFVHASAADAVFCDIFYNSAATLYADTDAVADDAE